MNQLIRKIFGSSRTRLLVYPHFQITLIAVNLLIAILTFGINVFQASRAFGHFTELGQSIHLSPNNTLFKLIDLQSSQLYSYMIISFFISSIVSSLITMVLSHRLAGPIIRLRGYMKEIADTGEVKRPLQFREGDFFSDLPEQVNGALKRLE